MKSTGNKSSLPRMTGQQPRTSADLQEQIRRRAQELYEQRGREDGHELEDWLQAEAELAKQKASAASASS